jgi:site-specific recombinase XerD
MLRVFSQGRLSRRRVGLRLSTLQEGHVLALRAAGRTPATIAWYQSRLDRLARFTADAPAAKISADELRRWLVATKVGHGSQPTTDGYVESHRKAAAGLFTWAVREKHLKASPLATVPRYRIQRHEKTLLGLEEVQALVHAIPRHTVDGIRNRAMLAVLYDSGLRVGELVTIRLGDIDLERGELHVRGKTGGRAVPMTTKARRAVWTYLHAARPRGLFVDDQEDRLFVATTGEPLRTTAVNQWLRRAAARAGIHKRISPLVLRRSFATEYIRRGGDPFTLKMILGHSPRSSTVNEYVFLAQADVRARHAQVSPLDAIDL